MSWFHKHKLELVGKTYAPPRGGVDIKGESMAVLNVIEKTVMGCTTFVWKCEDPECDKIVVKECLGKEIDQ